MASDDLISSTFSRALELGGLLASAGTTALRQGVRNLTGRDPLDWTATGLRIAETLGRLKGGAMKVGQMLSLQTEFLPPELAEALSMLQSNAPPLSFEKIAQQIDQGPGLRSFQEIEEKPFAAASIGQVHKARLLDGRSVIVKVQYPDIDRVVAADLHNLKALFSTLFRLISKADFNPVWLEIQARLLEELDYETEAASARLFHSLYASNPNIIIPEVHETLSTKRVLVMQYVEGQRLDEGILDQADRNWRGEQLFRFLFDNIFNKRYLHADPNMGNFAFIPHGPMIVYDFGCTKKIPESFALAYGGLLQAALANQRDSMRKFLFDAGIGLNGSPIPENMINAMADFFHLHLKAGEFALGDDPDFAKQILALKNQFWRESMSITFPAEIVFIQRSLGGHFGNLHRLKPTANWRNILSEYLT